MNEGRNRGIVSLTLLGFVLGLSSLVFLGTALALSIAAGVGVGSAAAWLCNGLQRYPCQYIDVRDTD